jgi:hypothetical protein
MNIQPAQQVPADSPQSDRWLCLCHDMLDCPAQATVEINANQLADVAEILHLLDGFLRHPDGVADRLAAYLHATRRDHPRDRAGYDANLLIDKVSFTAHGLRAYRQQPLQ